MKCLSVSDAEPGWDGNGGPLPDLLNALVQERGRGFPLTWSFGVNYRAMVAYRDSRRVSR